MAKGDYTLDNFKVGQVFTSRQGSDYTIIKINSRDDIIIEFNDGFKFQKSIQIKELTWGGVKNPYFPDVCGVGYFGVGKYVCSVWDENGKKRNSEAYEVWRGIMRRCYKLDHQETNPTYKGCSVNLIWHCFQNFAYWYYNNPYKQKGWHLDKDIIVRGNKEYGPLRCAFIPQEVNAITTTTKAKRGDYPLGISVRKRNGKFIAQLGMYGNNQILLAETYNLEDAVQAYNTAKNKYVYDVAVKWQGLVDQRIVDSLKNWTVREND